jgi:hypothetical protein
MHWVEFYVLLGIRADFIMMGFRGKANSLITPQVALWDRRPYQGSLNSGQDCRQSSCVTTVS